MALAIGSSQEIWVNDSDDAKRFKEILISTIGKELKECQ